VGTKTFKVHLDGPTTCSTTGPAKDEHPGPRVDLLHFSDDGDLTALRL